MIFSLTRTLSWSVYAAALFVSALVFAACGETVTVPKPRAYPKVNYPAKEYRPFDADYCSFTFKQPAYTRIERDTLFFDEKPESDCWFNITAPTLNAKIYCSYYAVTSRKRLDELVRDAFELTNKHNIKADYIEEIPVHRPADRVHGLLFNVEGAAASTYQFFLTDSTRHFLRGALYFNTQARPDSLEPVVRFMKRDLDTLMQTLQWR